ncbi:MAG: hypothetical protein LBL01_00935 [Bifidobacteriaceae bacterium]|jgi:hypothetical protein|nr:hypothetical protein [Bifidobacteriaceae bacterium]
MTQLTVGHPAPQHFRYSELSRAPKRVADAAERGPVHIGRRDGDDLVLMKKADADAANAGLMVAAQLVAAIAAGGGPLVADRLAGAYPWTRFLSPGEAEELAAELVDTLRACASVSQFEPLAAAVAAWRSTAEARAAGWGPAGYDWLDEELPVARPSSAVA